MHGLAGRIVLPRYNLSRLADRFERAERISREDCLDDRRGYFLVVMASGVEMRWKISKVYGPWIDARFEQHFTSFATAALSNSFAEVIRGLRDPAQAASIVGVKIARSARVKIMTN